MKKLKLKLSGVKEMLSREQMKKVNGGYGEALVFSANCQCQNGTKFVIELEVEYCPHYPIDGFASYLSICDGGTFELDGDSVFCGPRD